MAALRSPVFRQLGIVIAVLHSSAAMLNRGDYANCIGGAYAALRPRPFCPHPPRLVPGKDTGTAWAGGR